MREVAADVLSEPAVFWGVRRRGEKMMVTEVRARLVLLFAAVMLAVSLLSTRALLTMF